MTGDDWQKPPRTDVTSHKLVTNSFPWYKIYLYENSVLEYPHRHAGFGLGYQCFPPGKEVR
jgi:hypothetical protein